MSTSTLPARLLLATAALLLPLLGGGCERTACFTWSAAEGPCPARSEALRFFSSTTCPGHVISVDGEATSPLEGQLCCYAVSERPHSRGDDDHTSCGDGFGGDSSVVAVSSAFTTSVGQGGFGAQSSSDGSGDPTCQRCPELFKNMSDGPVPCGPSLQLFDLLFTCACVDACGAVCGDSFCQGTVASPECGACMEESTAQGCGSELTACTFDF